jgi:hypothetical protein
VEYEYDIIIGTLQEIRTFAYNKNFNVLPPTITPYTQTNNGSWEQVSSATICAGQTVSFGPQPMDGTWSWTGPNNYTSKSRQITFTNATVNQTGTYTATYTDKNNNSASKIFTLSILELPIATVTTSNASNELANGSIIFTFADNPTRTNITFSVDNGTSYTNVADNLGSKTFTNLAAGTYKLWTRWGNTECPEYLGEFTIPMRQTITLVKGWNLISTNVHPIDSSITNLFTGLDVQEIKTADGFWLKGQHIAFNSLKSITAGNGYLVNMNSTGTLSIIGNPCKGVLQYAPTTGWNIIGFPYQTPIPFSTNFNSTNCKTIKNFDGFWVPNGTSNSIQNFEPGKGYFMYK